MIKVYLGSDHGGFELKGKMKEWLKEWGYEYEDCGNTVYDKDDDYPDYAFAVARKVTEDKDSMGILGCRSAAGVVIAANKIKGVRAGGAHNIKSAKHMREHNDANVLAVSGDWLDEEQAKGIIEVFLRTKFSGDERHVRRLRKIAEVEI